MNERAKTGNLSGEKKRIVALTKVATDGLGSAKIAAKTGEKICRICWRR